MYTFKYEDDNVVVEVKTKEKVVTLDALIGTFEDFLRATGFNWINSIEHVKDGIVGAEDPQMNIYFTDEERNISARGNEAE